MFRNYDWRCQRCESIRDGIVEFPQGNKPPGKNHLDCAECGEMTIHERLLSAGLPYMGEKVLNPMVYGGKFDTAGYAPMPDLPTVGNRFDKHELNDVTHSQKYAEIKRERAYVHKQNLAKRKRAALIKNGANVNMRTDKLPGDPKVTA